MINPYTVIIVAGGSGMRFGAPLPKQYCMLCDKPVLFHTIQNIRYLLPQAAIILVVSTDYLNYWFNLCETHGFESPTVVAGGDTRWQSVKNALDYLKKEMPESADGGLIFVHDGARPIVREDIIRNLLSALSENKDFHGVVPVVPLTDSIRHKEDNGITVPVNRSEYVAVQTPQAFHANSLLTAYQQPYSPLFTDDASVVESLYGIGAVGTAQGNPYNIKITNPCDIKIAELYLSIE